MEESGMRQGLCLEANAPCCDLLKFPEKSLQNNPPGMNMKLMPRRTTNATGSPSSAAHELDTSRREYRENKLSKARTTGGGGKPPVCMERYQQQEFICPAVIKEHKKRRE